MHKINIKHTLAQVENTNSQIEKNRFMREKSIIYVIGFWDGLICVFSFGLNRSISKCARFKSRCVKKILNEI